MKKKLFSALLITTLFITCFTFWTPRQLAKENNDVSDLALMLPESDIIIALDVNKTLNVVGPSLLNQDAKKIDNLKKLMKSLENTVGINPYEINQIVAGIKVPSAEEKDFFSGLDFTVIFRTAHSNTALLENWSQKIDAIEALKLEKEPTEKYIDAFRSFRQYKFSKEETEKLTKSTKEAGEILAKTSEVNILLNKLPAAAKTAKAYKDAVKKNKAIIESVNRFQTLLKQDADVKNLHESSVRLQNRWNEISLDDAARADKLAAVLKESRAIYPGYKTKVENLARIEALINISNYEFYSKLSKKNFGLPNEADDFTKVPNEMMKEKLDEIIKTLSEFSAAKQTSQLALISKNLQRLEDAMNVRLKKIDEVRKFDELGQDDAPPPAKPAGSLSKSIKDNAKISQVNGKMMITIDPAKINFWNPGFGTEVDKDAEVKETEDKNKEKTQEVKIAPPTPTTEVMTTKSPDKNEHPKGEPAKADKKKTLFAIGYLDDKTMVIGFEEGIKSILSRQADYKNPKAAEMLNSFKNPLISFAVNSKVIENFRKLFTGFTAKIPDHTEKADKKVSPIDKFFSDVNIFGSIEYDGDNAATNDVIMSLGFSKNKVEEIFNKDDASEEETSIFEFGDYEVSKAIFYDLLNTLKAFKASVSFKFEKKKLAALIESAPQIIEDIRSQKTKPAEKPKSAVKTKIQNIQNIEDLITSPKFYTDLAKIVARQGNNKNE